MSDESDNFVRELEEKIEADLEVETIFASVQQPRSLSLGKSLPERPGNPIIKDKYFKEEAYDNISMPNEKIPFLNNRQLYMSKYRDYSLERQRIIFQEDYEAVNEIHQLLLSSKSSEKQKDSTSRSKSSMSEISSLESDFSRMFIDDSLEEN